MMKSLVRSRSAYICTAIAIAALTGGVATAGAERIQHPAFVGPQRQAAEEWVSFIDRGDQRDACGLQTVAEVGGRTCGDLPGSQILHCPKNSVVVKPEADELRKPSEQVADVVEESPDQAYAVLRSQRKVGKSRGAVGLELRGGIWRVSYLRQGSETYVPAGAVWMSEAWRRLWYPPTCSRRKPVGPTGG